MAPISNRLNVQVATHLIVISSVGMLVSLPMMMNCGLRAYDFVFHLVSSRTFADELWHGMVYPRWLSAMNAGFGSPTFFFYAPVPYYINSLFEPVAHLSGNVCLPLAFGAVVALIASGWTAYFWLRGSASAGGATFGAILYMLIPYHLSIDLYVRFAYAEFWAFVWMPLALLFARRLALGSSRAVVGLAVSGALLACTHLPTFLIFFPVPIGYAIVKACSLSRTKLIARLMFSYLLMAGLSAIYWLPALTTQAWISMTKMSTDKLLYSNNFLHLPFFGESSFKSLVASLLAGPASQVGPSVILPLVTVLLSVIIVKLSANKRTSREATYLAIIAISCIFMMFDASKFIWDGLPILQKIQFPTRFQSVLALCLAGLSALAVSSIRLSLRTPLAQAWNERWRALTFLLCTGMLMILYLSVLGNRNWEGEGVFLIRIIKYAAAAGLLIVFLSTIPLLRTWTVGRTLVILFWFCVLLLMSRQDYEQIFSARFDPATSVYVQHNISAAPEHLPRWVNPGFHKPANLLALRARTPSVRIIGSNGSAQVSRWRSRLIQLWVNSPVAATIEVAQFYYPGWTARLLPSGKLLPVNHSFDGLLQVALPAGEHHLQLALDGIPIERIGTMISGLSSVSAVLILIGKNRLRPPKSIRARESTA